MEGVPERDALTEDEAGFIQSRDSFYLATVTETGWPYIQHRGGKRGFLRVITPTSLAFADYQGIAAVSSLRLQDQRPIL